MSIGWTYPSAGGAFFGAGWLLSPCSTPQQVDNFVGGPTAAVGGAYSGVGLNLVDSPNVDSLNPLTDTKSVEIGIAIPSRRVLSRSANDSLTFQLPFSLGPGWGNQGCACNP